MCVNGITGYGSYTGFGRATDYAAMQSQQDADKVIDLFENAIRQGYNPVEIEQAVYAQAKVNPTTLMWYDKERIQRRVTVAAAANNLNDDYNRR